MARTGDHPLSPRSPLDRLEPVPPPRDVWPDVAAALDARQQRRGRSPGLARLVAVAASLLLVVLVVGLLPRSGDENQHELEAWMAYSRSLERELDLLRGGATRVNGQRALVMGELEDRIAAVDALLANSGALPDERRKRLWQERTFLLDSLVAVQTGAGLGDSAGGPPIVTAIPRSEEDIAAHPPITIEL